MVALQVKWLVAMSTPWTISNMWSKRAAESHHPSYRVDEIINPLPSPACWFPLHFTEMAIKCRSARSTLSCSSHPEPPVLSIIWTAFHLHLQLLSRMRRWPLALLSACQRSPPPNSHKLSSELRQSVYTGFLRARCIFKRVLYNTKNTKSCVCVDVTSYTNDTFHQQSFVDTEVTELQIHCCQLHNQTLSLSLGNWFPSTRADMALHSSQSENYTHRELKLSVDKWKCSSACSWVQGN